MENTSSFTSNISYSENTLPEYLQTTIFVCDHVLMPTICILGILGNGLSLCVLTRRNMAPATTCFLIALAVSDLLLLILQIPGFFKLNEAYSGASFTTKRFIGIYSLIRYVMSNVFITCTGWLTVAVTIERCISMCHSTFHPRLVCTIFRARLAITGIFIASFIFHFYKFFEYIPNDDLHSPRPLLTTDLIKTPQYETYLHITNIALAAIIPVFLLIVANSFLIYFLATHHCRMLRHKASSTSNMTLVDMIHVTAIVVATVLVFIVCRSVGVVLALTIASRGREFVFMQPPYLALKHINTVLIMINSSVNFLLYCAISSKFRKTFTIVFKRQFLRKVTHTSYNTNKTEATRKASNDKIDMASSRVSCGDASHVDSAVTK